MWCRIGGGRGVREFRPKALCMAGGTMGLVEHGGTDGAW